MFELSAVGLRAMTTKVSAPMPAHMPMHMPTHMPIHMSTHMIWVVAAFDKDSSGEITMIEVYEVAPSLFFSFN